MIQKHKIINELNTKVTELTKKCTFFEEKLSMAENEITSHRSRTPSVFDDHDSIDSYLVKKRRLDDYDYVKKKIKDSPNKDDLKKEIRTLELKAKHYEQQLLRKRALEQEYVQQIQEITKKNLDLEYKINFDLSK